MDGQEDGGEDVDPTAALGSPGGGGAGSGAVADGDDISDVVVVETSDIKEEANGDDANASPGRAKGVSCKEEEIR